MDGHVQEEEEDCDEEEDAVHQEAGGLAVPRPRPAQHHRHHQHQQRGEAARDGDVDHLVLAYQDKTSDTNI